MEIKVYLIEKQQIIREGYKSLLSEEPGIKIFAEATQLDECDDAQLSLSDVLMLECCPPFTNFFSQLQKVRDAFPEIKILVLTNGEDDLRMLQRLLESGVSGYLTKNASKEELFHSIKKVYQDGVYVCTAFIMRALKNPELLNMRPQPVPVDFNAAEIEILKLIADGLTNNDIALQLATSVRTIETRRKKILEKTNSSNTATLIRFAVKHGIIS